LAPRGENFNRTVVVSEAPDVVSQSLIGSLSGEPGYTVTTAGSGSIVLTRKFTPTWAVVVGIVGLITTLIGVLVMLYKETETLAITLARTDGGTRVVVSGVATPDMMRRVSSALDALPAGKTEDTGTSTAPAETEETKVCPACAETVKAAAKVCRFCGHTFEVAEAG
jgi:Uncharacterised protein family UPF0547